MQTYFIRRQKASRNFNEKGKKALDGQGQAWYSSSTCEKGLFSAVRIRCPGGGPLACGTQGGSSRPPPYHLGALLRPLALDIGLRQALSGVFFILRLFLRCVSARQGVEITERTKEKKARGVKPVKLKRRCRTIWQQKPALASRSPCGALSASRETTIPLRTRRIPPTVWS